MSEGNNESTAVKEGVYSGDRFDLTVVGEVREDVFNCVTDTLNETQPYLGLVNNRLSATLIFSEEGFTIDLSVKQMDPVENIRESAIPSCKVLLVTRLRTKARASFINASKTDLAEGIYQSKLNFLY